MITFCVDKIFQTWKKTHHCQLKNKQSLCFSSKKKRGINLQAVTGMDPKLSRYRTLQRQQLRSTLRSPGTLAARVGLHLLTGLLMGVLAAQENPLKKRQMSQWSRERCHLFFSCFFVWKKSQSVAYKCIRWLICKRILKFWPYDVIWWGRVSWTSLFAKKPCCKDVLGWIRINVVMLLKGIDGVPHEDQKVFHIGPVFKDINSCDHKAQRKSRERERERRLRMSTIMHMQRVNI